MTVPTSDNREQYLGNDSATEFDYAFKIFDADDLVVILTESDDTETTLVRGSDYSVDGVGEEGGGTLTYPLSGDPLATGETLTILREIPVVQETDLRNQGAYYPETLEDEFDRSRMIDQQQQEQLDRALMKTKGGGDFDADGLRIQGVGDAVGAGDAVSRSYLQAYIADIESGDVGDATQVTATGMADQRTLADWTRALGYPSTATGTDQPLADALNERATDAELAQLRTDTLLTADLTVNIPTDYATLQSAIDDLSMLSVKQGFIIDLVIETGHSPASGVLVESGDYGHFRISSVDATVTLDASFPDVDFIKGINAKMPTLNCLIDADGLGWSGYYAEQNSTGFVTSGNGVINAGRHGLLANFASNIYANNTVWTGASQSSLDWSGILAWASRITAQGADVSGSLRYGAQAAAGGVLSFRGGTASDCARYGVRATNQGNIDAREVVAHDCGRFGVYAYICSTINAMGGDVRRGGEANIASIRSSTIDFSLEGAAIGTAVGGGSVASLYASFNSRIHASGCSIINAESHAILAEGGSTVTCAASTIGNTTGSALRATGSSTIDAVNADIDGAAIGAYSSSSSVSVRSVSFTSITNDPVFITDGATVQAHGATSGGSAFAVGDTNADALNAFSSTGPSKGIVWA